MVRHFRTVAGKGPARCFGLFGGGTGTWPKLGGQMRVVVGGMEKIFSQFILVESFELGFP